MALTYKVGDAIDVLISLGKGSNPQKGTEQTYSVDTCLPSPNDPDIDVWSYTKISADLDDVAPVALRIGKRKSSGEIVYQRGVMSEFRSQELVEFEFQVTNVIEGKN